MDAYIPLEYEVHPANISKFNSYFTEKLEGQG
jgi:hypothetical protein